MSATATPLEGLQQLLANPTGVVVLDGGLATELEKDPRVELGSSSLWSASLLLDRNAHLQDAVVTAHTNYFLAGADIATTVSYQASVDGFKREGVDSIDKVREHYGQSINLGVQARDQAWKQLQQQGKTDGRIQPLVAASIGCYGAALADGSEYRGEYGLTRQQLVDWHRERFEFFAKYPGADFLACETIPCLVEVEAFVDLLNEVPSAYAMIAVACRNESELNSGEPIADLVPILTRLNNPKQLLAVGVNCTPPQYVESLLQKLDCSFPKLVYPNSGEGWDGVNKKWIPADSHGNASSWDEYAQKWFDAGARVFGGCCRTSPDDIRSIRRHFYRN